MHVVKRSTTAPVLQALPRRAGADEKPSGTAEDEFCRQGMDDAWGAQLIGKVGNALWRACDLPQAMYAA